MSEWLRLAILIGLGGVGVTLLATGLARMLAEDRRLARAFRAGLETKPDAVLIAHGSGRGVALSLAARRIVTVWDTGGWRIVYPLDEVIGVELDLDGQVAARAMRGEPRRLLDRSTGAEHEVRLRFLFDEPGHPDFELTLWPCRQVKGGPSRPREAIAEANRWIARIEALLRRTGGALTLSAPAAVQRPASPPPARAEDDASGLFAEDGLEDEDEDELAD
ncbi:MAG TPA: hypothetical protein VMT68_13345 [Caulobacteraceae bacterium]|nr:hypothetical protein [Caulobacteraceae bacterium]